MKAVYQNHLMIALVGEIYIPKHFLEKIARCHRIHVWDIHFRRYSIHESTTWAMMVLLMFFCRFWPQKLEKHQKIDGMIFGRISITLAIDPLNKKVNMTAPWRLSKLNDRHPFSSSEPVGKQWKTYIFLPWRVTVHSPLSVCVSLNLKLKSVFP